MMKILMWLTLTFSICNFNIVKSKDYTLDKKDRLSYELFLKKFDKKVFDLYSKSKNDFMLAYLVLRFYKDKWDADSMIALMKNEGNFFLTFYLISVEDLDFFNSFIEKVSGIDDKYYEIIQVKRRFLEMKPIEIICSLEIYKKKYFVIASDEINRILKLKTSDEYKVDCLVDYFLIFCSFYPKEYGELFYKKIKDNLDGKPRMRCFINMMYNGYYVDLKYVNVCFNKLNLEEKEYILDLTNDFFKEGIIDPKKANLKSNKEVISYIKNFDKHNKSFIKNWRVSLSKIAYLRFLKSYIERLESENVSGK
ncbi:MAG: hypothetical protein COA79_17595 [Planctomycetota bacterium]|nr:MAG: hypothetical protein COA79_17595 [Planctomycetota bacterium]